MRISSISFSQAPRRDVRRGLLGWVSFDLGGTWHVDGVAVRRTQSGRLALAFPSRIDRQGFEHAFLRPTCDRARRVIERLVLEELGLEVTRVRSLPARPAKQEPEKLAHATTSGSNIQTGP